MAGQVQDCVYFQLQARCARGSRCFFYHRQLEPDICRSFLFNRCKYGTNPRQCGKRHVTARDLPAVANKEKERVKIAKIHYKEALEELNKPVTNDEELDELKEAKLRCLDCSVELPTPWDLYSHQLTVQHCDVIKKIYVEGKDILGVEGDEAEWCIGCNVRFKSSHEKASHIKGKFHMAMAQSLELIEKAANSPEKQISCNHCKISNIPLAQMRSHLYSQKHVQVLQSLLSDKDDLPTAFTDNQRSPTKGKRFRGEFSTEPDLPPGVFVGNLSPTVEDWEIKVKFQKFGKVLDVIVPKSNGERDHTWAIVRFEKSDDAEKAIGTLHDTKMDGRKLRVEWKSVNDKLFCKICTMYCSSQDGLSEHYSEKHNQVKAKESGLVEDNIPVHVGNLPFTTNSLEIQAMFAKFGNLVKDNVPKVNVKNTYWWTVVHFTKMSNAEKAVEALNNKHMDGRRLVVQLKNNVKYYCELCKIYCTCQVNLEKHYLGKQHTAKKQEITSNQGLLDISDNTKMTVYKNVPQLSEFPPINDTPRKSISMRESASKLESMTKKIFTTSKGDASEIFGLEQEVSTISSNPKSTSTPKQMYSTICKSPIKPKTSGNPKPLEGLGEGRRHNSGQIECSMCGALFKYTQDFAKHCTSSEEHKAATARLEKRMVAEADLKRNDDLNNVMAKKQALNNNLGPKMTDRSQNEDQSQMLLQQMATQTIMQQQMFQLANLSLPPSNNPLLLYDGSAGDQVFTNTQIEREMYMKALMQRQTEMQLEQIYYENQRLAAQLDLNANIERIKQLDEMEKKKKKNIFLQQVEIGRLEELKKLKIKESDPNESKAAKKYTENINQAHHINTDIFQSDDEEEEENWHDEVAK